MTEVLCPHDWYYGECQICGETHPDDCLGCIALNTWGVGIEGRPESTHEYEAPDPTELSDDMRAEQGIRY